MIEDRLHKHVKILAGVFVRMTTIKPFKVIETGARESIKRFNWVIKSGEILDQQDFDDVLEHENVRTICLRLFAKHRDLAAQLVDLGLKAVLIAHIFPRAACDDGTMTEAGAASSRLGGGMA